MLHFIMGDITNENLLQKYKIDTIVNAANPTLMGNTGDELKKKTVDNAIHKKIQGLNKKIKDELKENNGRNNTDDADNKIRCFRGQAVITSGHKLCKNIIHVVGTESDAKDNTDINCSFSRIQKLSECYYSIVEILKQHREIVNIAIPIISAGNYGFKYVYAFKIAVASIGNALIDWKTQDEEFFETAGIRNIYFISCSLNKLDKKDAESEFEFYQRSFKMNRPVFYQNSDVTHGQLLKEIKEYDESRGYSSVTKFLRYIFLKIRILFRPIENAIDYFAKYDMRKRQCLIEGLAIAKCIVPIIIYFFMRNDCSQFVEWISIPLIGYFMLDTITYLLDLVLLADIQPPSTNIIRSIVLFFINYCEVVLETSIIIYIYYNHIVNKAISLWNALSLGILGECSVSLSGFENLFVYINHVISFFFLTLVFGYLASHVRLKKFRT